MPPITLGQIILNSNIIGFVMHINEMLPIEEDSHKQECNQHDDKSHSKVESGVLFQAH